MKRSSIEVRVFECVGVQLFSVTVQVCADKAHRDKGAEKSRSMARVPLKCWSCNCVKNTNDFEDLQKYVPNHDTPFSYVLLLEVDSR